MANRASRAVEEADWEDEEEEDELPVPPPPDIRITERSILFYGAARAAVVEQYHERLEERLARRESERRAGIVNSGVEAAVDQAALLVTDGIQNQTVAQGRRGSSVPTARLVASPDNQADTTMPTPTHQEEPEPAEQTELTQPDVNESDEGGRPGLS